MSSFLAVIKFFVFWQMKKNLKKNKFREWHARYYIVLKKAIVSEKKSVFRLYLTMFRVEKSRVNDKCYFYSITCSGFPACSRLIVDCKKSWKEKTMSVCTRGETNSDGERRCENPLCRFWFAWNKGKILTLADLSYIVYSNYLHTFFISRLLFFYSAELSLCWRYSSWFLIYFYCFYK